MGKNEIVLSLDTPDRETIFNQWKSLLVSLNSPFALYASPDWFETLQATDPDNYALSLSRTKDDGVKSILPLQFKSRDLIFSVARKEIFSYKTTCAIVLGGEPLGTMQVEEYDTLFQELFNSKKNIDAIFFKCLQDTNPFFNKLNHLGKQSGAFIHFIERKPETFTYVKLDNSFDEYLAKFNSKARYNLKRQWRVALKTSGNKLKIERITNISQMKFFEQTGKFILDNSWKSGMSENYSTFSQENCNIYKAVAEKGLLRSYVLMADDDPWAFVLGFQDQGIYHYSNIAYSKEYSKLSPGIVLFYKMMEDLFLFDTPDIVNFGIGDSPYKRRFGTNSLISSDHLLFRNNFKNKFMIKLFVLLDNLKFFLKEYCQVLFRNKL